MHFHCLKVDEGVNGYSCGFVVCLVSFTAESRSISSTKMCRLFINEGGKGRSPPRSSANGEPSVRDHGQGCDSSKVPTKFIRLPLSIQKLLVPRSIAHVKPPICLERWNHRSRFNKCSNVSLATFRMAAWPTFANIALRSSEDSVDPIQAAPSIRLV